MLSHEGLRSARLLRSCRNEFRGRRAVIIGNGPSLRDMDVSRLALEHTFGLNRVYLGFDRMGFSTTFLVSINALLISQVAEELAASPGRKFFRWDARPQFPPGARDTAFLRSTNRRRFAGDVRGGVWEGATVTYVALQLAFHMGFRSVVLVGVDHRFVTTGTPHTEVTSTAHDRDHFDPGYFGPGFRWQLPDLETSETAYRMARQAYQADGRQIVDATVNGQLRVFPRMTLEQSLDALPGAP